MLKRVLIAALLLCVTPCFAVDLRNTAWYGTGSITVTLAGQSESDAIDTVIVFTGSSPKKGIAAVGDLDCKWTSKSPNTPAFTLVPSKSAAALIAQGVMAQLPGAKVTLTPQATQGSASLQTGSIVYSVRFKLSVKYMGAKASGSVTISQSGYQIEMLARGDQRDELLPALSKAIAEALGR